MAYSFCVVYLLCLCSLLIINGVNSDEDDFSVQNCYKKADPGFCMAYMPRWYYNSTLANCTTFIYGGCNGNENRFESREECEEKCQNIISQKDHNHQSSHGDKPTPDGPCIVAKKKAEQTQKLFFDLSKYLRRPQFHVKYIPDCDAEGYYKPMQCKNKRIHCWCMDRWGNMIKRRHGRHKQGKPDELDCS